jgi:hypothetical protein
MKGKRRLRPLGLGAVVLAALVVAGCAAEAVNFNNTIALRTKKLEAIGKSLQASLQANNIPEAKRKAQELATAIEEAQRELAALPVPAKPGAKEFADAYDRLLKSQEAFCKNELPEMFRILEDPTMAPGVKESRILQLAAQAQQREVPAGNEFLQRQREFASKNGFKLQYK